MGLFDRLSKEGRAKSSIERNVKKVLNKHIQHEDRFAAMDEHSRSLAEEWTKSLNAAYELLVRETRGQS